MATRQYQTRLTDDEVEALNSWRRKQTDFPSAAETVRRLIKIGIRADEQQQRKREKAAAAEAR